MGGGFCSQANELKTNLVLGLAVTLPLTLLRLTLTGAVGTWTWPSLNCDANMRVLLYPSGWV